MRDSLCNEVQVYNDLSALINALNESKEGSRSNLEYIKEQVGDKNYDLLSFLTKFVGRGGYEYSYTDLTALVSLLIQDNTEAALETLKESIGCIKKIEAKDHSQGVNIIQQGSRLNSLSTIVCCLATNTNVLRSQTLLASQCKTLQYLFVTTSSVPALIASIFIAHSEALRLENLCIYLSIALLSDNYYRNPSNNENIIHKDNKMHALYFILQNSQADLKEKMQPLEAKLSRLLKAFDRKFSGSALSYIMKNENTNSIADALVKKAIVLDKYNAYLTTNFDAIGDVITFLLHHAEAKNYDYYKACLINAAKAKAPKVIEMLLSAGYGFAINYQDDFGKTALIYAMEGKCVESVKALVCANNSKNTLVYDITI